MGYNTNYTLTVESAEKHLVLSAAGVEEIIAELREESQGAQWALYDDGSTCESTKWYNSATELKAFSKKYPYLRFTLRGEGEESGDIWTLYVVNGKSQLAKAVVTVEPFDPNKLQ